MLKSIGSLHNIPAPSSTVLNEALKLLATFGDKKAIGALLEQVRDVQAKNEQVLRDAQETIHSLTVAQEELNESRRAFASVKVEEEQNLRRRIEELSQAEARLSGKVSAFSKEQMQAKADIADKEKSLADRERDLTSRELKCKENEKDLDRRTSALERMESNINVRAQQLQAKEKNLRAALDG